MTLKTLKMHANMPDQIFRMGKTNLFGGGEGGIIYNTILMQFLIYLY